MIEIPIIGIKVSKVKSGASEWALDVIKYLNARELPNKKWEAKKVKNRVAPFT